MLSTWGDSDEVNSQNSGEWEGQQKPWTLLGTPILGGSTGASRGWSFLAPFVGADWGTQEGLQKCHQEKRRVFSFLPWPSEDSRTKLTLIFTSEPEMLAESPLNSSGKPPLRR